MCKENFVTTIRMPEDLQSAVDQYAKQWGMSRTSAINYLLIQMLIKEGILKHED